MIYPQTILDVIDNTGVNKVKCIQVRKKKYNHFGVTGRVFIGVVISVKKVKKKILYKPGDIVLGYIMRTKKINVNAPIINYFTQNAAILLDIKNKQCYVPVSTRVFGPAPFLIKQQGYAKINAVVKKYI